MPDDTPADDAPKPSGSAATQFKPGQSGNPAGRPKGSRNRLQEAFISDLLEAWKEQGAEVIKAAMKEKPHEVLKVIAAVIPKEVKIKDELSDLSDEQLAALEALLGSLVADAGGAESQDPGRAGPPALN